MADPIAPPTASQPAEAVELVCQAVSGGDLEAAVAQYEAGAVLRPWARDPGGNARDVANALIQLMDLRLPLSVRICAVVPTGGLALVLGASARSPAPARTANRFSLAGRAPRWSDASGAAAGASSPMPGT